MLPCDQNGLPQNQSFLAISFSQIEDMFKSTPIANYAYVYMVQPLKDGIPPFCLACIGTDNKFTFKEVLQRWKYIYTELSMRGVRIVSFSADGDSRLLKVMRMTQGYAPDPQFPNTWFQSNAVPKALNEWLCISKFCEILCVQDMVHVGVKLKSRLLKPSIVLPLGCYIATMSHLSILVKLCGKDEHSLRIKDLDHKDKQNFNAVERIIKASHLLNKMPDAVGTKSYIGIIEAVLYSYLDKSMTPEKRLEEIWFATFFLRYWRQWVILHPKFSLKENFITSNAYMCVEVNAHSLLGFFIMIRDALPDHSACFIPWMLGSQTCERTFRSLRSMTGTFSTVINFSMLGLLQRLHKLYIQEEIMSESKSNGITFPRQEKYSNSKKDGTSTFIQHSFNMRNDDLFKIMKKAEERAKNSITELGMSDDLKKSKMWEVPPLPSNMCTDNDDDDDDDDDDDVNDDEVCTTVSNSTLNIDALSADVSELCKNGIAHESIKTRLKRVESSALPLYEKVATATGHCDEVSKVQVQTSTDDHNLNKCEDKTISGFVEVHVHTSGKGSIYICKQTAVWLFQETERVSSDRFISRAC